jgi:pimeloyl-ACP methyl ester carboxylesterase
MNNSRIALGVAAALLASLAISGCILLEARRDQQELSLFGRIQGKVETEHPSDHPLVVVLFPKAELMKTDVEDLVIVDHFVRVGPGSYGFRVEPGEYIVAAFEDVNEDGNYDPDEPLLNARKTETIPLEPGGNAVRDLVIPTEGRATAELKQSVNIAALQARSPGEQTARSIGSFLVRGEVVDLSDARFGAANGQLGLRAPLSFVMEAGAGIYFTEPFDPDRIPVLFVHGISGYPQAFTELIDSLDQKRFQAWFYFYPSGYRLDPLARTGAGLMINLQLRYRFDEFVVVAHSMGGLVSRALIFHYDRMSERVDIPLFVAISTPWGGDERAIKGVESSPVVLEVWRDMASNSQFLKDLFWRPDAREEPRELPESVAFHMMFSVRGASRGDVSTDGVVAIASELRREAQDQADSQLGLDYTHTSILRSPEARRRLNTLLDALVH